MKNLETKSLSFIFKGFLITSILLSVPKCSQAQIKYDTLSKNAFSEFVEPEFSYKTKAVWDEKENIILILTNVSLREDKLDKKNEITKNCLAYVDSINHEWKSLNKMSVHERFNYFRQKYFEDFFSSEAFPYNAEYQYFSVFKEKTGWDEFYFENYYYDFKINKFIYCPVKDK